MASIKVVDPLTGNKLHEIDAHSASDVALRFQSAREAQPAWAAIGGKARARVASQLVDSLIAKQEDLMDMLQKETGKSRSHAFEEITGALAAISYYAKVAPKLMKRQKVRGGVPLLITAYTEPAPVGAVGIVTPWNYPLALTMMDVIPALMAGNAVVQKADNQTAKTVLMARDIAVSAGVPELIWQVVHGEASEVGNALIDHCDYLAFTGSTATGKLVAQRAASRLIGYSLELGGKNPMIVLPGANVSEAAEMVLASAFGNAGQLCVSIERLYVPNHAMAAFELELKNRVESLKVGSSSQFEYDLGALSSVAQLERVSGFVQRAIDEGARLVTGGKVLREIGPNFYAPTVLADIPQGAEILHKEVFGPVIALVGYDSLDEAVQLANATEYGLNASVVGDKKAAMDIASRLMAGSVNINEGYRASMATMAAPMGGMKQSGMNRRSGPDGLLRFTENRTIGVANKLPIGLPNRARDYRKMAPLMTKLARWMGKI
ncbi:MAG: succinic semialdehyde dehydrogenase [Candidatus Aquiluna sp. XM-24bin5]|nr:MAG: succinic semialdehyde dehydrogenase [Candidatus Aquiluna sp. XM-24bin5]